MSESILYKDVDCSTCVAACCRQGLILELNNEEAAHMQAGGTGLDVYRAPRRRLLPLFIRRQTPDTADYQLQNDCGYLSEEVDPETGLTPCMEYDERPQVCRDFKPGSYMCRLLRVQAEVDTSAEFAAYDNATRRLS